MCVFVCVCNFITWRVYVNILLVSQNMIHIYFIFTIFPRNFESLAFISQKLVHWDLRLFQIIPSNDSYLLKDSFKWFIFEKFIFVWLECTQVNTYESHCFFLLIKYRLICFITLLLLFCNYIWWNDLKG